MGDCLDPIRAALDNAGSPVEFFFRADDVGWDERGLWRLLDQFIRYSLPVDLAVIPTELTPSLAHRIRACAGSSRCGIGVHQHGFAHVNHESIARKNEFGQSRARLAQQRDIAEGKRRLAGLLGDWVDPIFTPPWNRCTPTTGECLAELGFSVLSREGRAAPLAIPGLAELPVNVDWFAHRKGVRLSKPDLGKLVAASIRRGGPVGIMFHHAVMDDDERNAAGALLAVISKHSLAAPKPMRSIAAIPPVSAGSAR